MSSKNLIHPDIGSLWLSKIILVNIRMCVLSVDDDGDAEYLVKPDRYQGHEILRKVIEGLIFSMSGIPNLDDRDAMAQQSGEALKYLYATFEIMVAGDNNSYRKERKCRRCDGRMDI